MKPADKRLLLRVAQRVERQARARFEASGRADSAKASRDNEVGDALDIKDYVDRIDIATADLSTEVEFLEGVLHRIASDPASDDRVKELIETRLAVLRLKVDGAR